MSEPYQIIDGAGSLGSMTASVWLNASVGVELHAQVGEDGQYRTSVLTIGHMMQRADIFGDRAQMERLHGLIGEHLALLDRARDVAAVVQQAGSDAEAALLQGEALPGEGWNARYRETGWDRHHAVTQGARRTAAASERLENNADDGVVDGEEG